MKRSAKVRFSQFVLAREALREISVALAADDIPFMPLKGVLIQRLLYADPLERPIHDVDVLVRRDHFQRVIEILQAVGFTYRFTSASLGAVALRTPEGMELDLHFRLFGPGRYRMPTDAVFARARNDSELFGVPVSLMSSRDLYAHLIGKFASDRCDERSGDRMQDLRLLPQRVDLDAATMARHLVLCGMRRAARYSLRLLVEALGDDFSAEVLSHLPRDVTGEVLTACVEPVLRHARHRSPAAALPAHLLNHSLPRAFYAMGAAAGNRLWHRVLESRSRP